MHETRSPGRWLLLPLLAALFTATGCQRVGHADREANLAERKINAVATTGMIADAVRLVGGERVEVAGMMGPGVDPHLYRASEGDVTRMARADVIFYNGLHLEGKMADLFEQMRRRGIRTVALAEQAVAPDRLIASADFAGNYDPHIWFDVSLWMEVVRTVAAVLSEMDPAHASHYEAQAAAYLEELEALNRYVQQRAEELALDRRVLVTAHDAFNYFGRAYGFEVRGLQGISTATEAGTADVQRLARFIAERRIPAIFVESSVSPRSIEAVREAVRAQGFEVVIGGHLFSDALGNPGTEEGTYTGMVRHNIDTIVDALLNGAERVATRE